MDISRDSVLLPPNASHLEKNIVRVSRVLDAVPIGISSLWDVDHCPEELLPWLAWALSIDVWDDNWQVELKRKKIRSSFNLHKIKGTIAGIQKAIDSQTDGLVELVTKRGVLSNDGALDNNKIRIEFTEWWEKTPLGVPHTFDLKLWVNNNAHADDPVSFLRSIIRAIDTAKPLRSVYDFKMGAVFNSSMAVAGVLRQKAIKRFSQETIRHTLKNKGSMAVSGIVRPLQLYRFTQNTVRHVSVAVIQRYASMLRVSSFVQM